LCTLILEVSDVNGADFIRHSSFPKLKSADLFLDATEDVVTQNDNTSPILAISLPFLVHFGFNFPHSRTAFNALKSFIPHLIQLERITIRDSFHNSELAISPEHVNSLRDTLTILRPTKLVIYLNDYHSVRFLLEALDLSLLQVLDIHGLREDKSSLQDHIKIEPVMSIINTPDLTHLTIKFSNIDSCTHLLAHISADLQYLKASLCIDKSLFYPIDSGNQKGLHTMVEPFELGLCAILSPSMEGRVKFPNLSSGQFHLIQKDHRGFRGYVKDEVLVSEIQNRVSVMEDNISKMLERRPRAGAIRLTLKDSIQVAHEVDSTFNQDVYSCKFELVRATSEECETELAPF